jgi:predicted ATPase/class 3 adenylate cyclase
LRNLVPHFILENYRSGKTRGYIPAVGMFVDISGFSQITDQLMEQGQHGAEVLADVMRNIFSPLVQCTYEQGGFISTLAGDAFTAIYPVGEDKENACLRALSAAWQIQQKLETLAKQTTPYGEFTISGKIGIAKGEASWGVVTSEDERRAAYYIEGSAVEGSALAESIASTGQILVNSQVHSTMVENAEFIPKDDHFLVSEISFEPPPPEPINLTAQDSEHAYRFYPRSLFNQVHSGEFRQVVTMFVNLPTVRTEDQLDIFMASLFQLQDKYGGLLTRLDFGDKGSNLLIFWGAPLSYENDIERALNLILELRTRTSIPINAGITYRIAHAGFIGSDLREEYSTYGRGVNLAARFMTASQRGEIWVDDEIAKRADAQFEIDPDEEYTFKGFAQKQKVYLLEERKELVESIYQTSMVGRQAELDELTEFIQPLSNNEYCGALIILGEPGIGKSRLVHEFSNLVEPEFHWSLCQCDQAIRESLNPFRFWLRQYFSISSFQNEARNKRNFNRRLDRLIASLDDEKLVSELDRTRSFLGALIDLYWPDSLYEQVDPQGRYDNTTIGLISLIQAECTIQPVLLQLEDAQWLDEDSWNLISQLDRTIVSDQEIAYPLAIIATARPEFMTSSLEDGFEYQELRLGKLTQESLVYMSNQLLDGPASVELMDLIHERAEGNPFYTEQIIKYLQDGKMLNLSEGEWTVSDLSQSPLPDNIRALLVSKLDRLVKEVRQIVLTAAVLGREFDLQILSHMLDDDEALPKNVAKAEKSAIWSKINELRYLFNQALLLDAAYRMQVHSHRQFLHESAVKAIETIYSLDLVPYSADLAYHCERAGLLDKARKHLIQSGEAAKNLFQNSQAEGYITRALKLTNDEDIQLKIDLFLEREKLLRLLGNFEDRKKDLVYLNNLLDSYQGNISDSNLAKYRSRVAVRWASFKFDEGELSEAEDYVQEILSIAEDYNLEQDLIDAYFYWSQILYRQGYFSAAIEKGLEGLAHARDKEDLEAESRVMNILGLIALEQKNLNEAEDNFMGSLNIAKEINNLRDQAMPLNNLGNSAIVASNFNAAQRYYERSLEIAKMIGDRAGEGLVLGNLGYIAGIQGNYQSAREYNNQFLQTARQTGNRVQEGYALINISSLLRNLEEYPEALMHAHQSLEITQEIGDRSGAAWSFTSLGNIYSEINDFEAADRAYDNALEIRRLLNQPNLASEPLAGKGRIALETDDTSAAIGYINPIINYLEQGGSLDGTDDPIRVYLTCFNVLQHAGDPRAELPLEAGYKEIQTRADGIKDEVVRKNYLEKIPHNRELLTAWEAHQKKSSQ